MRYFILLILSFSLIFISCQNKELKDNDSTETAVLKENPSTDADKDTSADAQKVPELKMGKSFYEQMVSDYQKMGKWIISSTKHDQSMPFEIYISGSEIIGVIPQEPYPTQKLTKEGKDKYIISNSNIGEYYLIDSDLNMTLFDQTGDLTDQGFTAEKSQ